MTPLPQKKQCFEIREDELVDIFAFLHDAPDFIQEIEGDIRKHICASHSSAQSEREIREKVLDEAIGKIDNLLLAIQQEKLKSFWFRLSQAKSNSQVEFTLNFVRDLIRELRSKQGEQP